MASTNKDFALPNPDHKGGFKRAWKESHGTALLGFAGVILVLGMFLIWNSPEKDDEINLGLATGSRPGSPANADPDLPADSMLVRVVTDNRTAPGPIRIAIYDSKESFGNPDLAIEKSSLVPVDGFAVWAIKLDFLPEKFAIAAYHDLDDNGVLNRALFNAPVEPYGFSNNARSLVGPPTYEETLMDRPTNPTAIEVRVY